MKEIHIPDSIFEKNNLSIRILDYESSLNLERQRVILSKHTFSFLIEGEKKIIDLGNQLTITTDSFLLMKKGRCLMTEKSSLTTGNYRSILLFFSDNDILDFIKKYDINFEKNRCNKSVTAFEYDNYVSTYLKNLVEISRLPQKKQKNLLQLKLEEILIYLIEKEGNDFLFSMLEHNDQQSRKFISVIEAHKLNKLSIKELAFLCNMSVSSFKREFTKQYGLSPIKWFQNQRLEYASILLAKENKRPSEIYSEVGYENLSSFIQAFKSKYGETPKQHQIN